MAYAPSYKREAFRLYVQEHRTPEQIAAATGVSERTVQKWMAAAREAGKPWDEARAAFLLGPDGPQSITTKFVPTFFALMNQTITDLQNKPDMDVLDRVKALTSITDATVKAANALGRLNPQLDRLGVAMQVIKILSEFISREFPQHKAAFAEVLDPFGHHIIGKLEG